MYFLGTARTVSMQSVLRLVSCILIKCFRVFILLRMKGKCFNKDIRITETSREDAETKQKGDAYFGET